MAEPAIPLRESRERELVAATRRLFDERGFADAPVEEIAKAVGIARGLIYRQFSSKEELFVLTVTDYLDELTRTLRGQIDERDDSALRLVRIGEEFARFCARYPAFLDSSLAIMRRPAMELNAIVSESVWLRLGGGMAEPIGILADVLRRGSETGEFEVADPDFTANLLWTQTLGAMHLARIRVGMRRDEGEAPQLFGLEAEVVVRGCVESALATVGARRVGSLEPA